VDIIKVFNKVAKLANISQFVIAVEPLVTSLTKELWQMVLQANGLGTSVNYATAAAPTTIDEMLAALTALMSTNSRKALDVLGVTITRGSDAVFQRGIRMLGDAGGIRGSKLLAELMADFGGNKIADALVAAVNKNISGDELAAGIKAFSAAMKKDGTEQLTRLMKSSTADPQKLGEIIANMGRISAKGGDEMAGDVAELLPRLSKTGLLNKRKFSDAWDRMVQVTGDLNKLAENNVPISEIQNWLKSIRGMQTPWQGKYLFPGFLFELQVNAELSKIGGAATKLVHRSPAIPDGRSFDALINRVVYESKHSAWSDKTQLTAIKQIIAYAKSGLADKMKFVVPDAETQTRLNDAINKYMDSDNILSRELNNIKLNNPDFLNLNDLFIMVKSKWK
jgi:hypothetical protein